MAKDKKKKATGVQHVECRDGHKSSYKNEKKLFDIRLGWLDVTLCECDFISSECGLFFPDLVEPKILIERKLPGPHKAQTFFHELKHAGTFSLFCSGNKMEEEDWVDKSAGIMVTWWRSNPEVVKWVDKLIKG